MINVDLVDLGITDYKATYKFQKEAVRNRQLQEINDTLILTEHNSVFTIGRTGSRTNILVEPHVLATHKIRVYEIDRGGDVTYHGPGQIVIYPILDLTQYKKDIHLYLRNLEWVIIDFLAKHNIKGKRRNNFTGIWVGQKKIASIGIGISKWVTYHGISINISTDLKYFTMINPCGLMGQGVTSLSKIVNMSPSPQKIKINLIGSFEKIFGVKVESKEKLAILA